MKHVPIILYPLPVSKTRFSAVFFLLHLFVSNFRMWQMQKNQPETLAVGLWNLHDTRHVQVTCANHFQDFLQPRMADEMVKGVSLVNLVAPGSQNWRMTSTKIASCKVWFSKEAQLNLDRLCFLICESQQTSSSPVTLLDPWYLDGGTLMLAFWVDCNQCNDMENVVVLAVPDWRITDKRLAVSSELWMFLMMRWAKGLPRTNRNQLHRTCN